MNPPTILLPRTIKMQQTYDDLMFKNKNRIINLRKELFPNNEKWTLNENLFPYNFNDKTKHMIAWFNDDSVDYEVIKDKLRDLDIVFYENLKINRSISSIRHVHVFINGN
tara:strand:+ start:149 stop:478 length:330 start_codon:yes stop_codon:yes gene_type:complete